MSRNRLHDRRNISLRTSLGLALAALIHSSHAGAERAVEPLAIEAKATERDGVFDRLVTFDRPLESDVHLRTHRHTGRVVFRGDEEGYHSYRIPSLVRTTSGRLLAIVEGRRFGHEDHGDINVAYKTSDDHGATWSGLGTIAGILPGTWGNPTTVVDEVTGTIWLFLSWNSPDHAQNISPAVEAGEKLPVDEWGERRVFMTWSYDDGDSWAPPLDMTDELLPEGYTWDAVGPGVGIQTRRGPSAGRLIVPAIGRNLYSDDHGQSWQVQRLDSGTSEGTIMELGDGRLMRNDRPVGAVWKVHKRRMIPYGSIDLDFWSPWVAHTTLYDPKVQGSTLRYTDKETGFSRLLFMNSASTVNRTTMRVRISYDDGFSWPIQRPIPGPSKESIRRLGGYSSMAKTADKQVGVLIEQNQDRHDRDDSNRSVVFMKFNLAWILDGTPECDVTDCG